MQKSAFEYTLKEQGHEVKKNKVNKYGSTEVKQVQNMNQLGTKSLQIL